MPFDNPFDGSDPVSFLTKMVGGATSPVLDFVQKHPLAFMVALVICATIIIVLVIYILFQHHSKSSFGNGRVAGSGSGRNNQLQRAQQFELPLSQPELDADREITQGIVDKAGIPLMSTYDPPMENIYSGFGDKSFNPHVDVPQLRPQYPEGGQQEPFNQNVLNNIAYD